MKRTDTPTLIAELRALALQLQADDRGTYPIAEAADRLEEQLKLLARARGLLKEWGRSVTGFTSAPYIESADFLAATLSEGEAL